MRPDIAEPHIFERLLQHIEAIEKPSHRYRKLTNAEALFQILRVMKLGSSWRDTEGISSNYSWQSVYKRFRQWLDDDTFQKAWAAIECQYAEHRMQHDPQWFEQLFIDGTLIKNYGAIECCGRNPTDRGRSGTKISAVCDKNRQIIGMVAAPANVSDSHLTTQTLASIPFDVRRDHRRRVNVVGDKGYSSRLLAREITEYNRRFMLIAQRKKRAKKPVNRRSQSQEGKSLLKQRYVVENSFANMKNMKRLRAREEKLHRTFMSFVHLGVALRVLEADDGGRQR